MYLIQSIWFDNDVGEIYHVDSWATTHMCSDRNFVKSYAQHKWEVFLASGQNKKASGVGDGILQCINENETANW